MERAGLSATLDEGQSDVSVATTATLDVFRFGRTFNPALYGFVNLDSSAATAEGRQAAIAHCFADAMGKKPSGFHAARKHPLNLVGRNALLAGAHQMDDLQPKVQRQMRRLENGPHAHSEGPAALIALAQAETGGLASHLVNALRVGVA